MGVLSHELRTPLTVILGHARLGRMIANLPAAKALEKHVAATPDLGADLQALYGRIGEMMRKVEQSGDHLLTLINEILDFAKIDSGSLSVTPEPINVVDIVGPVADQMRPMIEEKGLALEVERIDKVLNVDGKRIGQVLINLVANACKFTDEGCVRLAVAECGGQVEFRVSDTGIGIPEDQLARIFEAFHQVDASPARRFGGTGLGLAISRDIAQAHGGTLRAQSVLGKGSVFVLSLPQPAVSLTDAGTPGHRVA